MASNHMLKYMSSPFIVVPNLVSYWDVNPRLELLQLKHMKFDTNFEIFIHLLNLLNKLANWIYATFKFR